MDDRQRSEIFFLCYEIKVLILGITAFILAITIAFLFKGFLYGSLIQGSTALIFLILIVVAFLLLITLLAVISLVIRQGIVYLFFFASVLALILPLAGQTNIWHWLTGVILFLWMVWARRQIRSDLENFVKPKVSRILTRGVKKLLSGFIIYITIFYFFSPQIQQAENLFISRRLFETISVPLEKMIQGFVPGFRKEMTVDEAILEIAAGSIFNQALKNDPHLKEASLLEIKNARQQFYEEFKKTQLSKQRQELSKQLGIILKGDEKIADIFYTFSIVKFQSLPASARTFLGIFMAVSLYFVLRIVAVPFSWLALAGGVGLFKILLITGFISVKKQIIEKEFAEV